MAPSLTALARGSPTASGPSVQQPVGDASEK